MLVHTLPVTSRRVSLLSVHNWSLDVPFDRRSTVHCASGPLTPSPDRGVRVYPRVARGRIIDKLGASSTQVRTARCASPNKNATMHQRTGSAPAVTSTENTHPRTRLTVDSALLPSLCHPFAPP